MALNLLTPFTIARKAVTCCAWRDVWVGAGVTAVLFEVGKAGIGLYLGKSIVGDSFATAGSLVVLVAWVYYAAQVFLLGAEFTKVYSDSHGSGAGTRAVAATAVMKDVASAGGERTTTARSAGSHQEERRQFSDGRQQRELDELSRLALEKVVKQALILGIASIATALMDRFQKRSRQRRRSRG